MSGETESNVSGWTTDTLLGHIRQLFIEHDLRYEQRFQAGEAASSARDLFLERLASERDKQVQVAFDAAKEASRKADIATEKRFEGVNEFRGALEDASRDLLPRREYEVQHEALVTRVLSVELWRSRAVGVAAVLVILAGALGFLVARAFV